MELAALSERHGNFLAPTFAVRVSGQDLMHQLAIGVSQVEVDLSLGAAGRFSFTIAGTFDPQGHGFISGYGRPVLDVLAFGAQVDIGMGYGDRAGLQPLLSGVVTEITTSFAEGGTPELSVAGYDHAFPMTLGKRSRSWSDVRDSDVVQALAREHHLTLDVSATQEVHAQVEQNQESDFELLKKLAERNHFEFYVDARRRLRFGPPRDKEDGLVTLRWGRTLLSFKPEANLAAQVSRVEVYGWDTDRKQPIVGTAVAGEESGHDPRRSSGGEQLRRATGREVVLQLRQPVFTEAEAKRRALALLNDHAKQFVTGEAECLGLPELLPDRNVNLADLGQPFSKTYYIQQATHRMDGGGYSTRIKLKETTL